MTLSAGTRLLVLGLLYDIRVMLPDQALAVVSRAELGRLLRERLLVARKALVKRINLTSPLAVRRAGSSDPAPDFYRLSWVAEKRWKHLPLEKSTVLLAGDVARRIFGGYTAEPAEDQLSHDAMVSSLWHRARRELPELMPYFWGEDRRKALKLGCDWGQKVPDIIFGEKHSFWLAHEFVGSYSGQKLSDFDADMMGRGVSYVLW